MTRWVLALALLGCASPLRQVVRYAEDATAVQAEGTSAPGAALPTWLAFLRERTPAAEAAARELADAVEGEAPEGRSEAARDAMERLREPVAAMEQAERSFAARLMSDPQVIDTIREVGADEVEALNTRHNELFSRLLRSLRAAGGEKVGD